MGCTLGDEKRPAQPLALISFDDRGADKSGSKSTGLMRLQELKPGVRQPNRELVHILKVQNVDLVTALVIARRAVFVLSEKELRHRNGRNVNVPKTGVIAGGHTIVDGQQRQALITDALFEGVR